MLTFSSLFGCVLLFTLLLIPGWILGRLGRIREESMETVGNLLTDIAMPALVLGKLLEVDSSSLRWETLLLCFLFPLAAVPFAWLVMRLLPLKTGDPAKDCVSRFCGAFPNCGFLGIPLAAALFPDAPEVAVYVSLFNVMETFLFLTMGEAILARGSRKSAGFRLLLTPVTAAVILGTAILLLGWGPYCAPAASYVSYFAALTTPLSMLVLGYELSKLTPREIFGCGMLYPTAAVKLIAAPLFTFGVLILLDQIMPTLIGTEVAVALLLSTGVSTAASSPAMAKKNGADASHATVLTLGTTLLCTVTLPMLFLLYRLVF